MKQALVVNMRNAAYDVDISRSSKWGNPFTHEKGKTKALFIVATRAEAIAKYEEWLKTQPNLMADLPKLKGKVLGCWCKPLACHGDVLVALIDKLCVDCGKQLRVEHLGNGVRCVGCYQDATVPDNEDG